MTSTFRIYSWPAGIARVATFTGTLAEAQDMARTTRGRLFEKCGKFWHFTGFDGAAA